MISVTSEAKTVLNDLLEQSGTKDDGQTIRLTAMPDAETGRVQLGLQLDQPAEEDHVVEHNGKTVLVMDHDIADRLDGLTLDTVDTPEGKLLTIKS